MAPVRHSSTTSSLGRMSQHSDSSSVGRPVRDSSVAREDRALDSERASGRSRSSNFSADGHGQRSSSRPNSYKTPTKQTAGRSDIMRNTKVYRWDGLTQSVSEWDSLRKDAELWTDGECRVHLYAQYASQGGPSFRVPLRVLRRKFCGAMFKTCYAHTISGGDFGSPKTTREFSFDNRSRDQGSVDLFIPAPDELSRDAALDWHITTRNFFAFILGKPLVGRVLGKQFVDLQKRLSIFRSPQANNQADFLLYIEDQGYRDLVDAPDYALACIYYAEHYKLRDVWIDAFAHCTGMTDTLSRSSEYGPNSSLTKALITRAHLEVDIRLKRVAVALHTFLEDDFSPTYLGLSPGARNHLDRFRKFLHIFYVEKFGYWPPPESATNFPKALYSSMYNDFKVLYNYLVDNESTTDIWSQPPASGGICVLQTVDSFDKRHKFTTQRHPLPLLPELGSSDKRRSTRPRDSLYFGLDGCDDSDFSRDCLAVATNDIELNADDSKIVRAFAQFEEEDNIVPDKRNPKSTILDGRKVRWLVIYGTLQYLTSALRAPDGVRDTETPNYPLCCLVMEQSSQESNRRASVSTIDRPVKMEQVEAVPLTPSVSSPSLIQPDCERDDYFLPRPVSIRPDSMEIASHTRSPLPNRSSFVRKSGFFTALSAGGSRRNSLVIQPNKQRTSTLTNRSDPWDATPEPPLHSPLYHGVTQRARSATLYQDTSRATSKQSLIQPDSVPNFSRVGDLSRARTPVLQLSQSESPSSPNISKSNSQSSNAGSCRSSVAGSSIWDGAATSASSKSSGSGGQTDIPKFTPAEQNGVLGGLVQVGDFAVEGLSARLALKELDVHPALRQSSSRTNIKNFLSEATDWTRPTSSRSTSGGVMYPEPGASSRRITVARDSVDTIRDKPQQRPLTANASMRSRSTLSLATTLKASADDDTPRKKSTFITPPSEVWKSYDKALRRHKDNTVSMNRYENMSSSKNSDNDSIMRPTSSQTMKSPSFGFRSASSQDSRDKRGKRFLSSMWQR